MKKLILIAFVAFSSVTLKADANATLQMRLALDAGFQARVAYNLMQEAFVVLAEPSNTPNHANRFSFATTIKNNINNVIQSGYVIAIVGRPNLVAATTTCDTNGCTTSATDASIFSQIASDWDLWSGQ